MPDYPITDKARQDKFVEYLRLHRSRRILTMWHGDEICMSKLMTREWDKAPDPFDMGPPSEAELAVRREMASQPLEPAGKWHCQIHDIRMSEGRDCTGADVRAVIDEGRIHMAYENGSFRYYVHPDHAEFWAKCVEDMGGRDPFGWHETEDGVDPSGGAARAMEAAMLADFGRMQDNLEARFDDILSKRRKPLLDQWGNPW